MNKTKENDLCLYVKGNYVLFVGKHFLIYTEIIRLEFHLLLAVFGESQIMGYTRKIDELTVFFPSKDRK